MGTWLKMECMFCQGSENTSLNELLRIRDNLGSDGSYTIQYAHVKCIIDMQWIKLEYEDLQKSLKRLLK